MKTSKFTEAQIAFVLKQAENGAPLAECAGRQVVRTQPSTSVATSKSG